MKPPTSLQQQALNNIGTAWATCPSGIKSKTLLSLRKRDLIEVRVSPVNGTTASPIGLSWCGYRWTESSFQWRRKPDEKFSKE